MAKLYGIEYNRRELEARVGSMKQIADLRYGTMLSGKENGVDIIELTNGVLSATLVPGRCLDLANLTCRGVPLNFTGKNGIVNAAYADPANHPLRSVNGGMFYTCGLTNVGGSYGTDYFHGQIRLCPAEQVSIRTEWEGDEYELSCSGVMRQNSVCGENLSLSRRVDAVLGGKTIRVRDTVRNDGFAPSPFMMMYHVVFGFPLLDAGARLYVPVPESEMPESARCCSAPTPEGIDNGGGVFRALANDEGNAVYCLYNPKLKLGLAVTYTASVMPYLSQWKSMQSGDYAMGLMPANCHASGRQTDIDLGTLRSLAPAETVESGISFTAIEGDEELADVRAEIARCQNPIA